MNIQKPITETPGWKQSFLWLALAVACFHAAYTSIKFPAAGLLIFGYAYGLVRLADQPNVRRAFYFGLATGYLCYAPQLFFLWRIFSVAAIVLWLVLAFWIGLFTAIVCGSIRRWGKIRVTWLIPIVWMGIEYFRSELYFLKFSWLNVGFALANFRLNPFDVFGMYGVGFVVFAIAAVFSVRHLLRRSLLLRLVILFCLLTLLAVFLKFATSLRDDRPVPPLSMVGVQLELPPENVIPKMLNQALAKNANASIFILSEYTLEGGVPVSLKNWCRDHSRHLIIGGKDFVTNDVYYNTAFVVGTNGEIVFKQVKRVPIQFFHDGLPAPKQEVWNSPWGKIGLCICYDLSYTRVTDELIRQGAQILIVPTMDVAEWGRHQHELHARVALERAAEYGVPIFRLASSGISQAISNGGYVVAQTRYNGNGDIIAAKLLLPSKGALPLDRFLAPLCVGITAMVTIWLLVLSFSEQCAWKKSSEASL
jgi:apolipoprotein N-acyltransferase